MGENGHLTSPYLRNYPTNNFEKFTRCQTTTLFQPEFFSSRSDRFPIFGRVKRSSQSQRLIQKILIKTKLRIEQKQLASLWSIVVTQRCPLWAHPADDYRQIAAGAALVAGPEVGAFHSIKVIRRRWSKNNTKKNEHRNAVVHRNVSYPSEFTQG